MLALIAWSAAGGAAWIELRRDRPEDPRIEEARREAALLRDRLEVVSADTVALADATERGFQGLATALEQRAANEDADVRALASRLGSLETELARLSHAEAERAERLAAALRELPSGARAALEPLPVEEPIATTPVFEIEPQAAPPQPAASRSFLAFKLPAHEQGFEGRRTYDVLGELSRVGFDAKSTLHDFTGTSGSVRGSVQVDLSRPADGISGSVEVEARSLSTSNEARDEAMLEHLDVERHPRITFTPSAFEVEAVDVAQRTVKGTVRGRMIVRGVEREVEMRVNGHLDEARRLVVEGEMSLALPDYGVEVPSKLGLISMEETVRVWVHLRARARLGESRR
jgi:polyisoprenoid-binding protein YceI